MRTFSAARVLALVVILLISLTNYSLADDTSPPKPADDQVVFDKTLSNAQKSISEAQTNDWRELLLNSARLWEEFIHNYPNSDRVPEAKLNLASYYKDIEKPEVYELKKREQQCWGESQSKEPQNLCLRKVKQAFNTLGFWLDPFYKERAAKLALEVLQKYGRNPRPAKSGEDLGALALLLLADIFPAKRLEYYSQIISEGYRLTGILFKDVSEYVKEKETAKKGN